MPEEKRIGPLHVTSVREACIRFLENKILSGEWMIDTRLPSERSLAASLEVSRLILHEAIVDLAAKGLVEIIPRKGAFVSDFRRDGAVGLLSSLMTYQNGELDRDFISGMVDMRLLLETETARLAALNCSESQLAELRGVLEEECKTDLSDDMTLTELDFTFHLIIAIASGNLMYPMIINSFRKVYTRLTGTFFRRYSGQRAISEVFGYHDQLITAVAEKESSKAAEVMRAMLEHGARFLYEIL
ncbi:MAG TPA: FCD domain-containing protein [Pelolinea sp.]|nr:FCD domain-containing protein [Pelolinea sp.]